MTQEKFHSDFEKNNKYINYHGDIFHYTSPEGLIGIIENKNLWFTNIYFLNDNNEIFYTYKLILKLLSEPNLDIDEQLKEMIIGRCNYMLGNNYFPSESEVWLRPNYYIASFSTNDDNLALWNYYTKSETTGYNICFNSDVFMPSSFIQGVVCYDTKEQIEMLKNSIYAANEEYKTNKQTWENLWNNFIIYSLFFKDKKYSLESEYRVIYSVTNNEGECEKCSFRNKNGLIIPYIEVAFEELQKIIPSVKPIKSIKISPLNNGEITRYGVSRLITAKGFEYIDVSSSGIDMKY